MSLFTDSSLCLVPSGVKDGKLYSVKPTDGSGDLTFTRSNDTATRVNSSGLVEKVRTNLLLQSNTFNTTWAPLSGASVTGGQAGYDGTNNAWLLSKSAAGGFIYQSANTLSGLYTISVYAKANASTYIRVNGNAITDADAFFNLSTGAVHTSSNCTARITSVGGGWYRCSISSNDASLDYVNIYPAESSGVSATSGSVFIQASQLETGDIATDYIATTSAAVSVGPVANLPRLDYSGGATCPSALLEPQRSNALLQSENVSSATWTKDGGTITANATTSPDGYSNADLFTEDSSNGNHRVYQAPISTSVNQAVTFSVFAKYNGRQYIYLRTDDSANLKTAVFDIQNGTAGAVTSGATSKIENYSNGWYRCTLSVAATANALVCEGLVGLLSGSSFSSATYTGDGTSGAYLWGFQGEVNAAYATSYIPTLSTAVTRVGDEAEKTGIASLIGQSEGTLFVEATLTHSAESNEYLLQVSESGSNRFFIYREGSSNKLGCFALIGGSTIYTQLTPAAITATVKAAFAYKSGSFAFYVNGVQVGTSSATYSTPPSMGIFNLDSNAGNENGYYTYEQTLLFPTRLSNADLATLTA